MLFGRKTDARGHKVVYNGSRMARSTVMGVHEQRVGGLPPSRMNRRVKGEMTGLQSGRGGGNERACLPARGERMSGRMFPTIQLDDTGDKPSKVRGG